ncbi:hypothetical protein [Ekhidna lutea]|nr:hypothetical protein [Ekhidna lutea]
MRKNKLLSFTIGELLIVMIITSIISISLYYSYLAVYRQFILFDQKQTMLNDLSGFHDQLSYDFNLSEKAIINGGILMLFFEEKEISYSINSNSIVRTQSSLKEEIKLDIHSRGYKFKGEAVNGSGLIDRLELKFDYLNHEYRWIILKEYDAHTLVDYHKSL